MAFLEALGRPPQDAERELARQNNSGSAGRVFVARTCLDRTGSSAVCLARLPLLRLISTMIPCSLRNCRSRRQFLAGAACGFGALACTLWPRRTATATRSAEAGSAGPRGGLPHFAPRARRVIFLFMQGGVSQVDSFDPKPRLTADDGRMMPF